MEATEPQPRVSEEEPKAFQFKGESDGTSRRPQASKSSHKGHRRHHSSRHRSKRSKKSHLGDDPTQFDPSMRNIGTDRAFQESLFDALGDDEGAAFWEGVYGQPIHTYPNSYIDEETGELEHMDDEEYAQYVRRKMWEKSREGIEAAREEQRRTRARQKTTSRKEENRPEEPTNLAPPDDFNFLFDLEIDASLGRGKRRKDQKRWHQLWTDYVQRWEELQTLAKDPNRAVDSEKLFLRNKIAWPVESGKRKDVNADEIERFVTKGAGSVQSETGDVQDTFLMALKVERVRWHPDKIQQRFGFMQIDESTMKGVTATFQALDHMWNELRETSKR